MAAEPMEIDDNGGKFDDNVKSAIMDRMSRTAGALGTKMLASLRSLNVLILGCRGVGIETAKNLILTGPKCVIMWDREPSRIVDMGANFYIKMSDVKAGVPRADAVHAELQSLNPYCEVTSYQEGFDGIMNDVLTRTGGEAIGCVIVTELLPKDQLYALNKFCRENGIVFLMGLTSGVTATVFSDFGDEHIVNDIDGEPTEAFAVNICEVVPRHALLECSGVEEGEEMVVVSVTAARHGFDDGDLLTLDDFCDELEGLNTVQGVQVKRLYYKTPNNKELQKELEENSIANIIKKSVMQQVVEFLAAKKNVYPEEKSMRTKQMLNRFVLDFSNCEAPPMEAFKKWTQGGMVNKKKKPHTFNHKSLEETLVSPPGRYAEGFVTPQHMSQECWQEGVSTDIHIFWAGSLAFHEEHKRWPALHNDDDAKAFYDICQGISTGRAEVEGACVAAKWSWDVFGPEKRDVDETRAKRFARLFPTELTGLCAFLGGAVAQEVVKKFQKYTPITQWLHYDDQNLITDESKTNTGPLLGTRYDWQVAVLGKEFQSKLADQKIFLVGCGALGCEYLKGLALMGVATGSRGHIWVTDMDRIEVSNLSRQFLFRQEMVEKPKSVCGAKVVKGWNNAMNIEALEMFVGPKTENFFDDKFWENLDLCWNALDNVKARRYTDSRCLFYTKPLLESGTLGTKCNGEIILPFRTKTYNDSVETDDNENQIAMCTLKNFPFLPLHCIEYARQSYFSDYFEDEPSKYESFRKDLSGFLDTINTEHLGQQVKILERIKRLIDVQGNDGSVTFESCLMLAFDQMISDFRNNIIDLIHTNPKDKTKQDGSPFWSGTKRFPQELNFDYDNLLAMEYLYCSANLYARVFGIEYVRDKEEFMEICKAKNFQNPEYVPKFVDNEEEEEEGEKNEEDGATEEMEVEEEEKDIDEDVGKRLKELHGWAQGLDFSLLRPITPHDFEKDDDENFHIDFLTIGTNLRAFNYQIKLSTRLNVKLIAGKIIPALATTTAMVCGLTELEFCKLVLGLSSQGTSKFVNSNINLATATFNVFEPEDPIVMGNGIPKNWTTWDKITLDVGDLTCGEFVRYFQNTYPGITFDFITNPNAGEKQNPALFDSNQAKIGQAAVETGEEFPAAIYGRLPALRMALQMVDRLPEGSANKIRFAKQVESAREYVKEGQDLANRNVYELFCELYGEPLPSNDGTMKNYLVLEITDAKNEEFEEVVFPVIKYVFRH